MAVGGRFVSAGWVILVSEMGPRRQVTNTKVTYVPALVLPSLAQTRFLGRIRDEMAGIVRLRIKAAIHGRVRALITKVEQ